MIGTHSPVRTLVVFFMLTLAAAGLALLSGCNGSPVSVPGIDSRGTSLSLGEVPLPHGHKGDVTTAVGSVMEIDPLAMRLRVNRMWFRADGDTEIELDRCDGNCAFADIAVGDAVKVKHERVADTAGDYYAREIEVENEEDDPHEEEADEAATEGIVTAVDGSSFEVAGSWFWTDAATEIEVDECAAGPVAIGDAVKVEHSTLSTAGFGFYAFKVELDRECEEAEESDG